MTFSHVRWTFALLAFAASCGFSQVKFVEPDQTVLMFTGKIIDAGNKPAGGGQLQYSDDPRVGVSAMYTRTRSPYGNLVGLSIETPIFRPDQDYRPGLILRGGIERHFIADSSNDALVFTADMYCRLQITQNISVYPSIAPFVGIASDFKVGGTASADVMMRVLNRNAVVLTPYYTTTHRHHGYGALAISLFFDL